MLAVSIMGASASDPLSPAFLALGVRAPGLYRRIERAALGAKVVPVKVVPLPAVPGDVVSLYFGAVRLPFAPYLAGSLLGLCPTMLAVSITWGKSRPCQSRTASRSPRRQ